MRLLSCAAIHGCSFTDDLMAIIQAAKRASLHSKLLMLMLACYSNMILVVRAPSCGSRVEGSAVTAERTLSGGVLRSQQSALFAGGVAKTLHHLNQLAVGEVLGHARMMLSSSSALPAGQM